MELGSLVHEVFQAAAEEALPNAQSEVKVDMRPFGLDSSGHIDLVSTEDGKITALEVKTVNGFASKLAVGGQGPAQGPRSSAIVQAALNGLGINADEVRIILLFMENISPSVAKKIGFTKPWQKFCAEWVLTREEYEPIAKAEIVRMNGILEIVDRGELAPRSIPDLPEGALITDPSKGSWTVEQDGMIIDAGQYWACDGYCAFKDQCLKDGA